MNSSPISNGLWSISKRRTLPRAWNKQVAIIRKCFTCCHFVSICCKMMWAATVIIITSLMKRRGNLISLLLSTLTRIVGYEEYHLFHPISDFITSSDAPILSYVSTASGTGPTTRRATGAMPLRYSMRLLNFTQMILLLPLVIICCAHILSGKQQVSLFTVRDRINVNGLKAVSCKKAVQFGDFDFVIDDLKCNNLPRFWLWENGALACGSKEDKYKRRA